MKKATLSTSFTWIIIAYIIAFAGAWVTDCLLADTWAPVWRLAAADTVATVLIFIFSMIFRNSSFYDPYWSVKPPLVIFFWLANPETTDVNLIRVVLVAMLTGFWAWRLTYNWSRSWQGLHHEDWRYIDLKQKTGKFYPAVSFLGIHYFPTILVFLSCLPMMAVVAADTNPLNFLDLLAGLTMLVAVIIENAADDQMKFARLQGKIPAGSHFESGLWKYSRHPNYFGEVLFWWGLFIFSLAASSEYWWTIAGPVSITLLFIGVSIPMMDARSRKSRKGFEIYMKTTSALVPWFRKKN